MGKGAWHVVEQGEAVESLAALTGHHPDTIWKAPDNDDLRKKRGALQVLLPGDRLFIPAPRVKQVGAATGAKHRFQVERPRTRLKLELHGRDAARANQPFVLSFEGGQVEGTTDGAGKLDVAVPPTARRALLVVGQAAEAVEYPLELHGLDPAEAVSGLQGRLRNLGYDPGPVDGELSERTQAALAAFQRAQGLEATGQPDDSTRSKLKELHGC